MHTFTALYDTREEAERIQRELQTLGIVDADGNAVAGRDRFEDGRSGLWDRGVAPPEPDRRLYEEGVRRGGFLLSVSVDDERADEVHQLLERSDAVDMEEREEQYRTPGDDDAERTGAPLAAAAASSTGIGSATGAERLGVGDEQAIPIVEERLVVGKRAIERGGARVRAYTVERPVHEEVQLREEHVSIERRPVDRRVDDAADLLREREIDVRETAEEAVVAKEARVIEEVVVRKDVEERVEEVDDSVRRTEVDVDRLQTDRDRDGLPG